MTAFEVGGEERRGRRFPVARPLSECHAQRVQFAGQRFSDFLVGKPVGACGQVALYRFKGWRKTQC